MYNITRPSTAVTSGASAPGTIIDHVIVPVTDSTTTVTVTPSHCSDHHMVAARLAVTRERRQVKEIVVRSTRSLVPDALRLDLLLADWSGVREATGVEEKWSAWRAVWSPVIDRHMPLVTIRPKHPPCPWLTDNDDVRALMRARDLARQECESDPSPETRDAYRVSRNQARNAQAQARADFFATSFRNSRRHTWKDIQRYLISSRRSIDTEKGTSAWSDRLNKHFASVGPRVAAAIDRERSDRDTLPPRPRCVVSGAFRVRPATLPELSAAVSRMSGSRACGDDGITIQMIRMTLPVIGPELLHVINASITSGIVPISWKMADVIPLHKSGCKLDPNNYRPVSILPTVEKITERIICEQLMAYLLDHNVLCSEQHGFRPGHSTESAMLDAVGQLVESMDSGLISCITTADTSKAFDSVKHARLLEKLGWYGVCSHWFENWLAERSQRVRGGLSTAPVTHGVIQGSLLGPILFLLFTNDLSSYFEGCKIVMYADDTQFIHHCNPMDLPDLKCRVEASLGVASAWFAENSLRINPAKTDVMLVKCRQRRTNVDFSVNFESTTIHPSSSVKILGMSVDCNLTWASHVSLVIRRCYSIISGLGKLSHRLPCDVKRFLIEALVFPHILYCLTVYGACGITQRHRLQRVLNQCARIVFCSKRRDHVSPLLRRLNWPTVEDLITERDVAMLFSAIHNPRAPDTLRDRIVYRRDVTVRDTRGALAGELQPPRVRKELARRFFTYRATSTWNRSPSDVRAAMTARGCRKAVRAWLNVSNGR